MNTLLTRHGAAAPLVPDEPPRILVADDEDALRLVLTRELRRRGFDVLSTSSGAEAVEVYIRSTLRIDLVLLDVAMPGMSGPDALDALREADPLVRCCFMTADLRPDRHSALLARGVLAVYGKPFDSLAELCLELRRVVEDGRRRADREGVPTWTS